MTKLAEYIRQTNTRQAHLAARLGISRSFMSELVGGTRRPSLELAFEIEAETGGLVPAASWARPLREAS